MRTCILTYRITQRPHSFVQNTQCTHSFVQKYTVLYTHSFVQKYIVHTALYINTQNTHSFVQKYAVHTLCTEYTAHTLLHTEITQCTPQSNQSAGPVRFLIFCSISIFLLASLVAGRRHQCNAGAVQQGMYSTRPIHWNIKSAPASPGRSRVGPAFYVFSFLGAHTTSYGNTQYTHSFVQTTEYSYSFVQKYKVYNQLLHKYTVHTQFRTEIHNSHTASY
jgi:hypothetical protein